MKHLHDFPNISKVAEAKLIEAGITTPQQLLEIGSKEAFRRIRRFDRNACLHLLYALEGAVKGVRKNHLSDECKQDLQTFFKTLA